ncbi:UNVERIFIED_CONTAM: carboxyltransferase domain-containing protein [Kocuria sp. CPCC 205316]|uniref:5-oxoprolinase subunit B family protein n=1 Tax=Kocuria TaxID=57493 RepID=UPI0036D998F9
MTETLYLPTARYTWGGDEFLFVEFDEAMNLTANYLATTVAQGLTGLDLPGVVDVCPANASLLVRFDPDVIEAEDLERRTQELEGRARESTQYTAETRIIEVPVWYQDPYTAEVVARFREGYHQDPAGTDLDYAAKVNGLADAAEFIRRHHESPWLVSMVGFVAGLPFMYQLVPRDRQLEVPKYLSPRTDTPPLTVGHGGCFACIYSVRGAGGYQMFGIAAAPIYDPEQRLRDFRDFLILFRPGDLVKFRPVDEAEYRSIQQQVEDGTWRYRQAPVTLDVEAALADPDTYNRTLLEALDGADD